MKSLKYLLMAVAFVWTIAFAQFAFASDVNLMWNTVSNADGYKVYHGVASRVYEPAVDKGTETTHTISLSDGQTYYFAVTAYNEWGESGYSMEVSVYLVPESERETPIPPEFQPGCNVIYVVPGGTVTINITVNP